MDLQPWTYPVMARELLRAALDEVKAIHVGAAPTPVDIIALPVDAPFVGDGFTRWVDGQYALDTPELGLSNWQGGRLLGRGGVLSGDSVHTIRDLGPPAATTTRIPSATTATTSAVGSPPR